MSINHDESIARQVQSSLALYPEIKAAKIKVKVKNGTVRLEGVVENPHQMKTAVDAARVILGVRNITNDLRIRGEGNRSVGEHFGDFRITAAIKTRFLAHKSLPGTKIHVETNDGIVTLSGEVDSYDDLILAGHIADRVDGVREVINQLEAADEVVEA